MEAAEKSAARFSELRDDEVHQVTTGQMAARMSVVEKWPEQIVELDPNMEGWNLDVVLEAFEMGYGRDDEHFFCQAEEIINPLLEKAFIVDNAPVSILADACLEVEAVQTCEAI